MCVWVCQWEILLFQIRCGDRLCVWQNETMDKHLEEETEKLSSWLKRSSTLDMLECFRFFLLKFFFQTYSEFIAPMRRFLSRRRLIGFLITNSINLIFQWLQLWIKWWIIVRKSLRWLKAKSQRTLNPVCVLFTISSDLMVAETINRSCDALKWKERKSTKAVEDEKKRQERKCDKLHHQHKTHKLELK